MLDVLAASSDTSEGNNMSDQAQRSYQSTDKPRFGDASPPRNPDLLLELYEQTGTTRALVDVRF